MKRKNQTIIFLIALMVISGQIVHAQLNMSETFPAPQRENTKSSQVLKSIRVPSGIRLEYVEQGPASGIPVIFLHGYMDSWQSFNQVLPKLPESIHAYSVSQRGHGGSDRPENGYDPQDFALDVADFMQVLNIRSAVIVGHSMGATVAQRFALDYPYMTRALVLVSSFASFKTNQEITQLQGIINKMEDPIDSGFVQEFQKSTIFQPVAPAIIQTYVNESMRVPARVWKAVAHDVLTIDYSKVLNEIFAPTLIIWGDKDLFCPRTDQYILSKSIKDSRLLIYEGVGHAVQWEDPQRFTNDFLEFIKKINKNTSDISEIALKAPLLSRSFY